MNCIIISECIALIEVNHSTMNSLQLVFICVDFRGYMRNLCETIKCKMDLTVSRLKLSKHVTTEIAFLYSVFFFVGFLVNFTSLLHLQRLFSAKHKANSE